MESTEGPWLWLCRGCDAALEPRRSSAGMGYPWHGRECVGCRLPVHTLDVHHCVAMHVCSSVGIVQDIRCSDPRKYTSWCSSSAASTTARGAWHRTSNFQYIRWCSVNMGHAHTSAQLRFPLHLIRSAPTKIARAARLLPGRSKCRPNFSSRVKTKVGDFG